MDMVERLALALCEFENRDASALFPDCNAVGEDGWSVLLREDAKNYYRAKAMHTIEAMREPTDEQRNNYYELSHRTETFFDAHWERAIDALLKKA